MTSMTWSIQAWMRGFNYAQTAGLVVTTFSSMGEKRVLPPSVVIVGYWFPLPFIRHSPRRESEPVITRKTTPEKTPLTLHARGVSGVFVRPVVTGRDPHFYTKRSISDD
ncbi:hypothetical protein HMPREF0281_02383 [Corynebacterium ammoniagenes DSM 20306]|uniref:Uncharacterized protein n=1 Tax=Corynebacterium ammoniagenes DSM 20306 TaxID=649754 RepID=A0ABN0AC09_CORAM|nr:hypothetical protein HMPREF0281_02383 [Corynebacterium ammoniagenes DSM 20306]